MMCAVKCGTKEKTVGVALSSGEGNPIEKLREVIHNHPTSKEIMNSGDCHVFDIPVQNMGVLYSVLDCELTIKMGSITKLKL